MSFIQITSTLFLIKTIQYRHVHVLLQLNSYHYIMTDWLIRLVNTFSLAKPETGSNANLAHQPVYSNKHD